MRVGTGRIAGRLRRLASSDSGAAAVLVAVVVLGLFAAALISIDAGSVWTTRRHIIIGTDAAALAAAGFFAANPRAACEAAGTLEAKGIAASLLAGNYRGSEVGSFSVTPTDCIVGAGTTNVETKVQSPAVFAKLFGIDDVGVSSHSTAQWGSLVEIERLRPLALCSSDPNLLEWANLKGTAAYDRLGGSDNPATPHYDHPGTDVYPGSGVVHRLASKDESDCKGDVAGNWGWLDFNGNEPPNGTKALKSWFGAGYELPISLGGKAQGDEDCRPTQNGFQDCEGKPKQSSLKSALESITCSPSTVTEECSMFPTVVYDSARGKGSKAEYHPVAFLGVVLRGFGVNDDDGDDDDDDDKGKSDKDKSGPAFIDLEFVNLAWDGQIGATSGSVGVHGVQICGVDPDSPDRCDL